MAKEKFLLAYSGGLDTSIIIPWLLEHYDCEVVAYCGEVGVGVDHSSVHPWLVLLSLSTSLRLLTLTDAQLSFTAAQVRATIR